MDVRQLLKLIPDEKDRSFVGVWLEHGGETVAVAEALGVKVRAMFARRRTIEKRYSIRLDAQRDKMEEAATTLVKHGEAVVKFKLKSGVILVGGDAHYWPGVIPTMHRGFVHLAKTMRPHAVVMNGDAFDGAKISRWPSIGWEKKPDVNDELKVVKERLEEIKKAAPGATRFWTAGNHDLRFESRLAQVASEYREVHGIHLKDHFPDWTPCWLVDVNDTQAIIRHRESGGVHASYNNALKSGTTIVTGHDHRADVVTYNDYKGRRWGARHGMMADSARDPQFVNYLEAKAANWQSALCVLTWLEGRLLTPELAFRFDDDHIEFRGQVIRV